MVRRATGSSPTDRQIPRTDTARTCDPLIKSQLLYQLGHSRLGDTAKGVKLRRQRH